MAPNNARNGSRNSSSDEKARRMTSLGLKKGPWSIEEDAILMEYVNKHGEGNWNAVQKNSGLNRCGKSCRLRWANHLRPNLKKTAFTPEEERILVQLHAKFGNKWARIAIQLPGRTDNEIKNYWNTRLKRRLRAGLPVYPNELRPTQTQQFPNITSPNPIISTVFPPQNQPQYANTHPSQPLFNKFSGCAATLSMIRKDQWPTNSALSFGTINSHFQLLRDKNGSLALSLATASNSSQISPDFSTRPRGPSFAPLPTSEVTSNFKLASIEEPTLENLLSGNCLSSSNINNEPPSIQTGVLPHSAGPDFHLKENSSHIIENSHDSQILHGVSQGKTGLLEDLVQGLQSFSRSHKSKDTIDQDKNKVEFLWDYSVEEGHVTPKLSAFYNGHEEAVAKQALEDSSCSPDSSVVTNQDSLEGADLADDNLMTLLDGFAPAAVAAAPDGLEAARDHTPVAADIVGEGSSSDLVEVDCHDWSFLPPPFAGTPLPEI